MHFSSTKVHLLTLILAQASTLGTVNKMNGDLLQASGRESPQDSHTSSLTLRSPPVLQTPQLHSSVPYIEIAMKPTQAATFDHCRGVTWVHVVQGQWLLTATSDSSVSEVSLWVVGPSLDGAKGFDHVLTATAYLAGPVAQGFVDVQDGGVVIALEVQSK